MAVVETAQLVDWIDTEEAARICGVSVDTMKRWRTRLVENGKPKYGPSFKKNPGAKNAHVQYRRSVCLKFVADLEAKNTRPDKVKSS